MYFDNFARPAEWNVALKNLLLLTCVLGVGVQGVVVGKGGWGGCLGTPEHLTHTGRYAHYLHCILEKRKKNADIIKSSSTKPFH